MLMIPIANRAIFKELNRRMYMVAELCKYRSIHANTISQQDAVRVT